MKTTRSIILIPFLLTGLIFMLTVGCKKNKTDLPLVTTTVVTGIGQFTATSGGDISDDGGSDIIAKGVCWGTSADPTIDNSKTSDGAGTSSFTSVMEGLVPLTTYYVRAYATNSDGTGYGSSVTFSTLGVTDIDGNTYHTVVIGTQTWMLENLKVTKYRTGDALPEVSDNITWTGLTTGAYCNYHDSTVFNIYGRLYNWHTVNDPRNIAPAGWHVPTDADWQTLVDFLGGTSLAGGKMKGTGNTYWHAPNTGATNSSGFTALPGGLRMETGLYYNMGDIAGWWSANSATSTTANYRSVSNTSPNCNGYNCEMKRGLSIRCIKD